MLKGLALTPPVVGRISIGKVVEKNGHRLPEKDDEFTVTSQVQNKDGWVNHPVDQTLRTAPGAKLRSIPVRLLFDDPDLNLRANYSLFDRKTGRPLCVGNGETCRRSTLAGIETLPCPSPQGCELAVGGNCKPCGRLNVRIGDEDELGSFLFRTTGYNSIRTLSTRLKYFHAVSGGLLSTLPLELRLRGKSTTQSHRAPIYYVDLTVRTGMALAEAIAGARAEDGHRKGAGFDQLALEDAARQGFANGAFEESEEEGADLVEEFYPDESGSNQKGSSMGTGKKRDLGEKLHHKAAKLNGVEGAVPAL
ncbi:MAG: hydrolase or metal-binding protein [Pseudomonadota bacterium]